MARLNRWTRTALLPAVMVPLVAGGLWAAARPGPRPEGPLPLHHDGTEGDGTVRDGARRVLLVNLRAVEPGVLYRASAFVPDAAAVRPDGTAPARAWQGPQAFERLRALGIRHVVSLAESQQDFWAEEGYFRYWSGQTGHAVRMTWLPVDSARTYDRHDRSALRAAAEVLMMLRAREPGDGAVLVHGEAGQHAVGVVAAAYELWRNRGLVERETLWELAVSRYLASNRLLAEHGEEAGLGMVKADCAPSPAAFVCRERLEQIRAELEFLARVAS